MGAVVGSAFELAIPVAVFLSPRMNRKYQTRAAWRPSMAHFRDVLRLGWPAGLMFVNEMLCWAYLMAYMLPAGGAARAGLADLPPEQLQAAVERKDHRQLRRLGSHCGTCTCRSCRRSGCRSR